MHRDRTSNANGQFKDDIWRYLEDLLRVAMILTHRQDQAEDLVQDTVLKALRAADTFQPGTNMKAWLLTILRRTHIDHVRAQQRVPLRINLDDNMVSDPSETPVPDELDEIWSHPARMIEAFEDEQIVRALRELPPEIQWTLLLVDVQELDHEMAARIMDVPVGTVKSRAFRGRMTLRERLAARATANETDQTDSVLEAPRVDSRSPCPA